MGSEKPPKCNWHRPKSWRMLVMAASKAVVTRTAERKAVSCQERRLASEDDVPWRRLAAPADTRVMAMPRVVLVVQNRRGWDDAIMARYGLTGPKRAGFSSVKSCEWVAIPTAECRWAVMVETVLPKSRGGCCWRTAEPRDGCCRRTALL